MRWLFSGQSARPVYLLIEGGRASLQPAEELWGRDTAFVTDALEKGHGSQVHVAAIGPAGEAQVRYASIVADRHYQAMRLGVGAVMGAKRLKAVALVGGSLPPAADPKALAGITTLNASRLEGNDLTRWQKTSSRLCGLGGYHYRSWLSQRRELSQRRRRPIARLLPRGAF